MNRFIYIEIKNYTGEISNISPYKTTNYKNLTIINKLNSLDYTGFIIDTFKYLNKHRCSKPNNVPLIIHKYITNKNRKEKIKKLKKIIKK